MERVPRVTRGRDGWARWGCGGLGTPPTEASESGSAGRRRTAARAEGEHQALELDVEAPLRRRLETSASTRLGQGDPGAAGAEGEGVAVHVRSEEHTSELQSLMRISYAVS